MVFVPAKFEGGLAFTAEAGGFLVEISDLRFGFFWARNFVAGFEIFFTSLSSS